MCRLHSWVTLSESLDFSCLHFSVHLQNKSLNYVIIRVLSVPGFLNEYLLRVSGKYFFSTYQALGAIRNKNMNKTWLLSSRNLQFHCGERPVRTKSEITANTLSPHAREQYMKSREAVHD